MKKQTKKPLEMAVIFKSKKRRDGTYTYKAVDIVLGYFDEKNMLFQTKNGDNFHFISNTDYIYGFCLRKKISELKVDKKKEEVIDFMKTYLEELKKYTCYFRMDSIDDYKSFSFVATNKKTNQTLILKDEDVEKIRKQIIDANKLTFNAKNLSDGIKSEVIGQDEAIDDIVTTIWQNFRSDNSRSNILLIGSTGVGKTEIIRNISKRLDVPMVTINATKLSPTAYKGASIDDFLAILLKNANYDIQKASRGIIFIDEIDKKASIGDSNDGIITTNIQDELLNLLEDGEYEINIGKSDLSPQFVKINTKHITFICAGAFAKMKELKDEPISKTIKGFRVDSNESTLKKTLNSKEKITHEDLVKYGLKTELVGRLNNIIELNNLSKDNLITIMKNPNNQTIQEKINILDSIGVKTNISEEVYDLLADNAIEKKTGARGLVSAVDNLFSKAMIEISRNQDEYDELIITKETIENPKAYKLIRKKEKEGQK